MAWYIDKKSVKLSTVEGEKKKYNTTYKSGKTPTFAGIYKCQTCDYEDVINRECDTFPPCRECDGSEWKLLVKVEPE